MLSISNLACRWAASCFPQLLGRPYSPGELFSAVMIFSDAYSGLGNVRSLHVYLPSLDGRVYEVSSDDRRQLFVQARMVAMSEDGGMLFGFDGADDSFRALVVCKPESVESDDYFDGKDEDFTGVRIPDEVAEFSGYGHTAFSAVPCVRTGVSSADSFSLGVSML